MTKGYFEFEYLKRRDLKDEVQKVVQNYFNIYNSVTGTVDYFANLPSASANLNKIWLVRFATTFLGIITKQAGLYISDGTNWNWMTNLEAKAEKNTTISAGNGLTGGGDLSANRTISHSDTSSQVNVVNTGGNVLQSANLDDFGHITSFSSIDLDNRYITTSGAYANPTWITSLDANKLTGTIPSNVLGASTVYIGTTAIALNRASGNQALTGLVSVQFAGATSGTATLQAPAVAGTTTFTLPTTSGNLIGSGDTGTVSGNMLANSGVVAGTYQNATTINPLTIDAKGRITNTGTAVTIAPLFSSIASKPTTISGYGITDGVTLTNTQTLTNKTFTDDTTFFQNDLDNTKKAQFQLSNIATATTRTYSLPNVDGTIITTGDTATVTNAMLAGSIANGKLNTITAVGKVNNSATTATNLNTANAIVSRDASGNFSAGTITGELSGNSTTATTLQTFRNINGVAFNGSANITITANTPNALTIASPLTGGSFNGSSAISIGIQTATSLLSGALSNTDWNTFNTAYNRSPTALSVTGTSTKTITLTKQDGTTLTANWSDLTGGTVTSVFGRTGAVVATEGDYSLNLLSDVTITSPTTNQLLQYNGTNWVNWTANYLTLSSLSATSPLSYNNTTGLFSINQSNTTTNGFLSSVDWNIFNNKQNAISLTTTGNSGASSFVSNVLNIPNYTLAGLGGQPLLSGTGFVKANGTVISYDNSTYLTANQTITLSGDVAGSGKTAITTTLANSGVTAGTYTNATITVDSKGRVTVASSPNAGKVNASYLLVGGGGGSGINGGGGGGGGGVLTGKTTLTVGTVYSFTIGGGGAGSTGSIGGSVGVSTIGLGLTAIGGGGGSGRDAGPATRGATGGGGGGTTTNVTSRLWSAGSQPIISGQGFAGGAGTTWNIGSDINANSAGGGGGGAGGIGHSGTNQYGGYGGIGITSDITGSNISYGGGGGGGVTVNGTAGVGSSGGGNGGQSGTAAQAGTNGLGGGGGGAGPGTQTGLSGGSGVAIIRLPTANYTGTVTGSPTVTTVGSDTVIRFTANGSYTA